MDFLFLGTLSYISLSARWKTLCFINTTAVEPASFDDLYVSKHDLGLCLGSANKARL